MRNIAIIAHGGAGDQHYPQRRKRGLMKAVEAGYQILRQGGSSLDAVEKAAMALEDAPVFNAGTGSYFNLSGEVEMDACCKRTGTVHHEWLQCYKVAAGREHRITEQGEVLIREKPDALYVWAWKAQIGTTETCADSDLAWRHAAEVLRKVKE